MNTEQARKLYKENPRHPMFDDTPGEVLCYLDGSYTDHMWLGLLGPLVLSLGALFICYLIGG